MDLDTLLLAELKGSVDFFWEYTNRDSASPGYGLTVDATKKRNIASIAAVGFALTAWVIGAARGYVDATAARDLARGTLRTLLRNVPHYRGFFAHFLYLDTAQRVKLCEYSTIDTALCLNGVITAAAYFHDAEIDELAQALLARVDWAHFVAERDGRTLLRMAYNPDRRGDYVSGDPGFLGWWDMAAEQKMLYLQAAGQLQPALARRLYQGFARDTVEHAGQKIIVNPDGNLFAYLYSKGWLDVRDYVDGDGLDWFNNTRLAVLANRDFCIQQSEHYRTYHANSWGLSAGDSPKGYYVSGAAPSLRPPTHNGTVCIYAGVAALPFAPNEAATLALYLYHEHPRTWGRYGFFDAYNLDVTPGWYSRAVYGIDKGISMIMIENHLTGLVWEVYTQSPGIQAALGVLGFRRRAAQPVGAPVAAGA
jgi:hypothetical protein